MAKKRRNNFLFKDFFIWNSIKTKKKNNNLKK